MTKRQSLPSATDVARLAGVSQAAVSRAFTPGASISAATRAKVMAAAKALAYRPNLLARSLITGKSGLVGVVIGNPRNAFYLEALDALSTRLAAADRHLLVFTARGEGDTDWLIDALLSFRVDSLVLMSATLSADLAEQCRANGIPVIFFNRRPEPDRPFPSVTSANHEGGAAVAQHLFDQGYRRLAVIAGQENSSASREREAGFLARAAELGLAEPRGARAGFGKAAMPVARELLAGPDRPDALFCTNDMTAMAAIEAARFDLGLRVGPDVGVAGFDDIEGASWRSFDLTTYSQEVAPMVERVIAMVSEPAAFGPDAHVAVSGQLIVRGSTRRDQTASG